MTFLRSWLQGNDRRRLMVLCVASFWIFVMAPHFLHLQRTPSVQAARAFVGVITVVGFAILVLKPQPEPRIK